MPKLGLSNSLSSSSPYSKFDRWSLAFDGSDDYLDTGEEFKSTIADEHSVSFWIKFADARASGTKYIIGAKNSSAEDNFYIAITSGGQIKYYIKGNNDSDSVLASALADGTSAWMHVIVTASIGEVNGDTGIIYLDGAANTSTSLSSISKANWNAYDSGQDVYIGSINVNGSSSGEIEANISDMALYNTVLTPSQVTFIYNGGAGYNHVRGVASSNLVAWWRMGDGVENAIGTTIYDKSANSYNGTMTNMAADDFEEDTP